MKFKVGDRVKRISGKNYPEHNMKVGNIYTLSSINGDWITLEGTTSSFNSKHFELVNSKSQNIGMKLNSMMKKLLDPETRKLVKGGLLNGDLLLTNEGEQALQSILVEQHKKELVTIAEEVIKEEKEK